MTSKFLVLAEFTLSLSKGSNNTTMANLLFQEFIDPFQPGSFIIRSEYYMRYRFAGEVISKQQSENSIVYDLGCGNGYGLKVIAETVQNDTQNYAEFYGFDKSQELLNTPTLLNYPNLPNPPKVSLLSLDLDEHSLTSFTTKQKLPAPDIVIAFEILEHLENPEKTLKEVHTLLPENSLLIVSVPNAQYEPKKKGKPKSKFHRHLFTEESITELLKRVGFRIQGVYGQPYTNSLYHKPKWIGGFLDNLTNTFPATIPLLSQLIATPKLHTATKSYSIIITARK